MKRTLLIAALAAALNPGKYIATTPSRGTTTTVDRHPPKPKLRNRPRFEHDQARVNAAEAKRLRKQAKRLKEAANHEPETI